MRVRRSWLSVVTVLGLLALVCGAAMAQPPGGGQGGGFGGPGGQGGRGMMGSMNYIERAWTAMFFELGCSTEQLQNLYATFGAAWNTRKDAQAKMRAGTMDFQAYGQVLQQIQQTIDAKLKEVLTADQQKKWEEFNAQQQMPRGNRGGQGGPGGGGGGGG
jgi:Spy/CpxP family protein refolding chaperone